MVAPPVLVEVTGQPSRVAAIAGHSTAVFHLLGAGKAKPSGTIWGHPMHYVLQKYVYTYIYR